jgi:hypothetical protein
MILHLETVCPAHLVLQMPTTLAQEAHIMKIIAAGLAILDIFCQCLVEPNVFHAIPLCVQLESFGGLVEHALSLD